MHFNSSLFGRTFVYWQKCFLFLIGASFRPRLLPRSSVASAGTYQPFKTTQVRAANIAFISQRFLHFLTFLYQNLRRIAMVIRFTRCTTDRKILFRALARLMCLNLVYKNCKVWTFLCHIIIYQAFTSSYWGPQNKHLRAWERCIEISRTAHREWKGFVTELCSQSSSFHELTRKLCLHYF